MQNIPFCFSAHIILNNESKRQEKYILFASISKLIKINDSRNYLWVKTFTVPLKITINLKYNSQRKEAGIIISIVFVVMSQKS